ncbi:MAG TPA: hypothetical protein VH143_00380 [Kofleriaceae bacterium]|jgi:hypothetical protein|nr:hypothetical protein [Kofleriaceae bacterium]
MKLGNVVRVALVAASCAAAIGSASSNSNNPNDPVANSAQQNGPPQPQQMDAQHALGLWRSTFGAVKIDADNTHGGIGAGAVHGVWEYTRQGTDVIGYFYGTLQGNVLRFKWQEPANPPLTGEGFLVFEQTGRQYSGRWWSDHKDRVGDWNGWRGQQPGEELQGYPQQQGAPQQGYPQAPQDPNQGQQQYPQQPQQGYPPPQQQGYPQQPPQQPQQQPPQQPPSGNYY